MKRFMVVVPEIHLRRYIVIANSPESATETIMKGGDVEVEDSEFSHTLDTDEWEVDEVDDGGEIIT